MTTIEYLSLTKEQRCRGFFIYGAKYNGIYKEFFWEDPNKLFCYVVIENGKINKKKSIRNCWNKIDYNKNDPDWTDFLRTRKHLLS